MKNLLLRCINANSKIIATAERTASHKLVHCQLINYNELCLYTHLQPEELITKVYFGFRVDMY